LQEVVCLHGLPLTIVSDWRPQFASILGEQICTHMGIDRRRPSAFDRKVDSQMDRLNNCIEQCLWVFINHLQDDWVKWFPLAEFAINNGTSESTMTTAFCAVDGRDPRMTFVREPTDEWHCPHFDSNHVHATLELTQEFHSVGMPQSNRVYEAEANRGQISALNVQEACHAGLEGQHIRTTRPAWKLDWKHLGPVKVLHQVSLCTYDFKFPALIHQSPIPTCFACRSCRQRPFGRTTCKSSPSG
jgi:hypothetical protein